MKLVIAIFLLLAVPTAAFGGAKTEVVQDQAKFTEEPSVCKDDPTGEVEAAGFSCAMLLGFGCGWDLSTGNPAVPTGSFVKLACPVSCGACGGGEDIAESAPALSMEPIQVADGSYEPSPFAISVATSPMTKYAKVERESPYTGANKILVVCTDDGQMRMTNGKVFSSGNHPVEMIVPLLHFRDAGFQFDFATVSGGPVVLEMWAFPNQDENVKQMYEVIKPALENPLKLEDIPVSLEGYIGIFAPGGHGAMINLPQSAALGDLLREANKQGMPTAVICHGPAALLSTTVDGGTFPYGGYEAVTFTDNTDKMSSSFGYIPGEMEWFLQETLRGYGMVINNQAETGATKVDRELITGDGPPAANAFGLVAAPIFLEYAQKN